MARASLRGQVSELDAMHECLRNAQAGRGSVLFVEGRRGIGKSSLLREAAAAARNAGFRVGTAPAVQGDEALTMAPLKAALFGGSEPVFDSERVADPNGSEDAGRLVERLESALQAVARTAPILIAVDDAQWADDATIAALRVLQDRLSHLPIVWLIAFRNREPSPLLHALVIHLNGRGAESLLLRPLDENTVAQLVADVVRAAPEPELLELVGRAGGIPGLIVELVEGLVEEELVQIESGRAALRAARVPQRVSDLVREELARLSVSARHTAGVASILGTTASFDHVAAMLDVSPTSLLRPIDELVRAELLADTGKRLTFCNDLVREAVVMTVPPAIRNGLRRQAIDVLLAAGESPIEPAMSLASTAEPGDRNAISTLLSASRALRTSDVEAAAALCRLAFDLTAGADDDRPRLVAEMTLLLHTAGQAEQARQLADEALRGRLRPDTKAAILLSVARMSDLAPTLRTEAGRDALTLPGLPLALRARHLSEQLGNVLSEGRRDVARDMLADVEAAVAASGDPSAAFARDSVLAHLAYTEHRFLDALRRLDALDDTASDDEEHTRFIGLLRADALLAVDEFDTAHRCVSDGLAGARRDRRSSSARAWQRLHGRAMLQAGRVLDAAAMLDDVFTAESADAVASVSDAATLLALGRFALQIGDSRRTRTLVALAEGVLANGAPELRRHAAWLLVLHAMAGGDAARARDRLAELDDDGIDSVLPSFMIDIADYAQLARIARDAGDDELGATTVAVAEAMLHQNPGVTSIAAVAAHARGLLDADTSMLAEAVRLFAAGPRRLAHASALEDHGVALVRDGDRAGSVDALGRALKQYTSSGAAWDASRVRRRLRDLGVRRRIVKSARPTTGWEGLTDAEVVVVRLVAEGLTNREVAEQLYVSPHTVSMHLRHVFTKLEISSRVELTRLALRQDEAA